MRRSLIYFWRIQLAVLLGAAVATAVLTGALLVGDSVRGSLRDLTLDRLGRIDYALASERFFREGLATDLSRKLEGEAQFHRETVPAILLNGAAVNASTKARASRVQIQGNRSTIYRTCGRTRPVNPLLPWKNSRGRAFHQSISTNLFRTNWV